MSDRPSRRPKRSPLAVGRVTIGLLIDWAVGAYQKDLIFAMAAAALKRNVNLLCFTGGSLALSGENAHNAVFSLAGPDNADALIVAAAGLGNEVGQEGVERFCEQFQGLPLVSVTAEIKGAPCLLVDNQAGMREIVVHLIRVHRHRRIAFVRGHHGNVEIEGRYRIYCEVLNEEGLEIDERLIVDGARDGTEAVGILADRHGIRLSTLDAIIAYNDVFAVEILQELERRGIRVPDQVAVGGFDDIEEGRYSNPPLTTVRQPLRELGAQAIQLATDLLSGIAVPERTTLPTQLVVRGSCRCFARAAHVTPVQATTPGQRRHFETALVGRRDLILADIARSARGALGAASAGWEGRLFTALLNDLRGSENEFLKVVDQTVRRVLAGGGEVRVFYQVLVALRRQTVPALDPGSEQRERAEVLFHEAASIVSETLERAEAHGRMQLAARADLLAGAVSTLTDWPTRDFSRMLAGELPKLGIALLYVASFVRAADTSRARLFLAFDAARKLCVDNSSETFASGGLMPTAVAPGDRPVAVVVAPLSFEGVSLGFLLVELSSREPSPYYVLASLISNALHLARRDDSAVDVISTLPPAAPPPVTAPPSLEEN